MSLAETIKTNLIEYAPMLIPGVAGLHYYYQNLPQFQRLNAEAYLPKLSTYLELSRLFFLAPVIIKSVTNTERLGVMAEPAFAAGMYSLITLIAIAGAYILKRKMRGGKEEEQTHRLEQIIAQHAGQSAKS